MAEIFEIIMVVSFGVSWPFNVYKSYKSRTAKGKSLAFLILILVGYFAGITAKLISPTYKWYVLLFYIINTVMVAADLVLYFRNVKIDRQNQISKA